MKTLVLFLFMTSLTFAQQPIAIVGATLIDGTGVAPVQNSVIIIQGTKVVAVGTKDILIPKDASLIDARGKYVIPGLIDCHIHYEQPRDLVQLLAWGVTSVNCMFESTDQALEMERHTANDTVHSPQIYATAPIFTCEHGWWWGEGFPNDSTINRFPKTPDEAREAVRKVKAKGIKRIKLMYDDMSWCRDSLPRLTKVKKEVMEVLIDEAGRNDLLFEVHAPRLQDAREVFETARQKSRLAFAHGIIDEKMGDGSVIVSGFYGSKSFNVDGAFYVPTFCVFKFLADTKGFMEHAMDDKRFRSALAPQVIQQYTSEGYYQRYAGRYPNISFVRSRLSTLDSNLTEAYTSQPEGIALGTDMWALPGIGVHLELEYMVQAGMEARSALLAATNYASNFLGEGRRKQPKSPKLRRMEGKETGGRAGIEPGKIGTIESSKQADLLILDANPLEDIRNTRSVKTIVKHGQIFDHQQLIEESMQK